MKGKNEIMKRKTKSFNDVYNKIIACLILVAMFTVYLLPLENVFGETHIDEYWGNYFDLEIGWLPSLNRMLEEFRWEDFKAQRWQVRDNYYTYPESEETIKNAQKGESKIINSPIKLPTSFPWWMEKNNINKINLSGLSETYNPFFDLREFESVKAIDLTETIVRFPVLNEACVAGYFDNIDSIYMNNSVLQAADEGQLTSSNIWKSGKLKGTFKIRFSNGTEVAPDMLKNYKITLYSDSKELLERIAKQAGYEARAYGGEVYSIDIPKNNLETLASLNFSGINLNNLTQLPDFQKIKNLEKIDFRNCGITSLVVFENAYKNGYFNKLSYKSIELGDNTVNNINCDFYTSGLLNTYPKSKAAAEKDKNKQNPDNPKPGTPQQKVTEQRSDNGSDNTTQKNLETLEVISVLQSMGCTDTYINALQNGNYATFDRWWRGEDPYNKPNFDAINRQTGDWLCDKLIEITGIDHNINWGVTITYNEEPEVNYTLNSFTNYKDHKFILQGSIKAIDSLGNEWDISPYLQIYDEDRAVWHGLWWDYVEVPVEHNGNYQLHIGLFGTDFQHIKEYYVDDIDTEKPKINSVTPIAPEGNGIGTAFKINVSDDSGLKSVYVENTKNTDKHWTIEINGDKEKTVEQSVRESGEYRIVVEDMAGNKEETIENIKVDTEKPKAEGKPGVEVIGKSNPESYKGMPVVKKGDKVKVSIKANKKIKSIGNPNNGLSGVKMDNGAFRIVNDANNYDVEGRFEMQNVGSQTITVEMEITEKVIDELDLQGSSGAAGLQLYYVRDEYNNQAEDKDFKFSNLFYIDDSTPSLTDSNIITDKTQAQTYSDDKTNEKVMFIQNGKNIIVELTFDEQLNSNPVLKIGSSQKEIETQLQASETKHSYKATINCDELIKEGKLQKNSDIPITVTNIVDKAGHQEKDVVIDKNNKSSNKYSLYYGVMAVEDFYLASNKTKETIATGDINADGLVNNYDKLLLNLSKASLITLNDEELKRAKIDIIELEQLVDKQINYVYKNISRTFKVYNGNNELVDIDNLEWQIIDGDGKIVNDSSKAEMTFDKTTNEMTLTIKDNLKDPITINAYEKNANSNVKKMATSDLLVEDEGFTNKGYIFINGENNTGHDILGDVNNDGYITAYDSIYTLQASVKLQKLTGEEKKRADVDKDGEITSADALAIFRISAGVDKGEDKKSYDDNTVCNIIKKGNSVTLDMAYLEKSDKRFTTYHEMHNADNLTINWELISNNENAFTLTTDDYGYAELKSNDVDNADGAIAIVKATVTNTNENEKYEGIIYWKVSDKTKLELSTEALQLDLNEQENIADIIPGLNIENQKINYTSKNPNVAEVKVDEFGNAKVLAKASGESLIVIESDGESKEIKVDVKKAIESIDVNKTDVTVRQGKEEEFTLTVNPTDVTEDVQVVSKDTNIATVRYDETSKTYKIKGEQEGNTTIEAYSPSNSSIKKTINVKVDKQDTPTITKIIVENVEEGKILKAGDEIFIRVNFDGAVAGTAPNIKLKFGDYQSKNKANFVEGLENNTVIRYKYKVADGDNGELMVEKLSGGLLTDITKKIAAITSKENDVYNSTQSESTDKEYINDGIYEKIEGVTADTTNPAVRVLTIVDKDTNWLKNGDEIKVQVVSEEALKEAPTVLFNEKAAKVEGEGTVFTASLPVTSELADGYLEIKVDNMVDTAGNTREAVVAKESNINEPIIIDNSAPTIASVNIGKEEGKEYAAGETFNIIVKFKDVANVTKEYITASEIPGINLKFGGKAAQGTITSDYEAGKYVEQIKYTYTVAQGDKGEVTVDSMSGIVEDVAGNVSDLSKVKIASNSKETPVSNVTYNNVKAPKTGDNLMKIVYGLIAVVIVLCIAEYLHRKNKKD